MIDFILYFLLLLGYLELSKSTDFGTKSVLKVKNVITDIYV